MISLLHPMFLLLSTSLASCQGSGISTALQVAEGRVQYEMVTRESSRPRYGPCWTEALTHLQQGCKHLDDEVQGRLALAFANCFLAKAGQRTYPCPRSASISSCLEEVDSIAFNSYSNFFTHTQNMCYFLQSQVHTPPLH